jgi:hypothetical protein
LTHRFGVRICDSGQSAGMGIGAGIFLLALGAILTIAVDWKVAGLDLHAVGWVLMAAGAVGMVLFFYFWNRHRVAVLVPQPRARKPLADEPLVQQPLVREPVVREPHVYDSRRDDDPRRPPP